MLIALQGFVISLGLIVAIGPQNAYVLRKGLHRHQVFAVASVCFLGDALLIGIAAAGVGGLIASSETFGTIAGWGGGLFLIWYGAVSFRSALKAHSLTKKDIEATGQAAAGQGYWAAILTALAFTFLNPHAYLDTLVILGGLASQYETADRLAFAVGAIAGSAVWFYGIGYGAGIFAPWFARPQAWRILDTLIGIIMWSVGGILIYGVVSGS